MLAIFNPHMYGSIYDEHGNPKVGQEPEWEIPQSEADVQRILQDMKKQGLKTTSDVSKLPDYQGEPV